VTKAGAYFFCFCSIGNVVVIYPEHIYQILEVLLDSHQFFMQQFANAIACENLAMETTTNI
jgi:hypothetical protein